MVHGGVCCNNCRHSRETGEKFDVEIKTDEGIFEYVDDKEYNRILRKRQADNWVLGDGRCMCVHACACVCAFVWANDILHICAHATRLLLQQALGMLTVDVRCLTKNMTLRRRKR